MGHGLENSLNRSIQEQACARVGPGTADVLLLTKAGLEERVNHVPTGEAPRDFFYNFYGLLEQGVDTRILNTSAPYTGQSASKHRLGERLWARMTGISRRHHYLDAIRESWAEAQVAVSFTDQFSLTLGSYFCRHSYRPATIGLFHGLSDLPIHMTALGGRLIDGYIRRALAGLDIVGFFGPADREEACRRYGIDMARTEVVRFGIDTAFWRPAPDGPQPISPDRSSSLLAIGSDPNRDYDTLTHAGLTNDITIVTRLPIEIPREATNIIVRTGSYWGKSMTDVDLRKMLWEADAVVVPLRDVLQPTGYSVTLQAMACGRPVILSDIRGLWTPEYLTDGENCLLIEPGSRSAICNAVARLTADPGLSARLISGGLDTIEKHFTLTNMYGSMNNVVDRARALHADRKQTMSPPVS